MNRKKQYGYCVTQIKIKYDAQIYGKEKILMMMMTMMNIPFVLDVCLPCSSDSVKRINFILTEDIHEQENQFDIEGIDNGQIVKILDH